MATTATKTGPVAKSTETTSRCDAKKVAVGSVFSRHSHGTVVAMNGYDGRITLRNSNGFEWHIDKNILEQEFSFADQFDSEEDVSRTRAIEVLTEHSRTAMTIMFNKTPDAKAVAEAVKMGQGSEKDKDWQKRVKSLISGEERVMVGYHSNTWDEHRRLHFIESGVGPRLVDPRTLNWVIVNRVRYTVK